MRPTKVQAILASYEMSGDRESIDAYTLTELIDAYYDGDGPPGSGERNPVGGALHIVLDDFNVEGRHIVWCIRKAAAEGDPDAVAIGTALLDFDYKERARIVERGYRRDAA